MRDRFPLHTPPGYLSFRGRTRFEFGLPLKGWNYRKRVTLSRESGAVVNHQMRLVVGQSVGGVASFSPKMYANNAPSPCIVSVSSDNTGVFPAWHATDGNPATIWNNGANSAGAWWKIQYPIAKIVSTLTITNSWNTSSYGYHTFKLQGSNNDADWTDIYSGECNNTGNKQIFSSLGNTTAYLYYRVLCVTGYNGGQLGVVEITLLGADVKCETSCLSSFNDIRFTKSDGITLLNYWIESIDTTGGAGNYGAIIWVKFDSVETSATPFYMYYGNSGAVAYSSLLNTGVLLDDFEWGANGDHLHTNGGTINWSAANDFTISTTRYKGSRSVKSTVTPYSAYTGDFTCSYIPTDNMSVSFDLYRESGCSLWWVFSIGNGTKFCHPYIDQNTNVRDNSGIIGYSTNNTWEHWEYNTFNWAAGTFNILKNGNVFKTGATMETSSSCNGSFCFGSSAYFTTGRFIYVDNFMVRDLLAIEPLFGSWGAQES